MTGARKKENDLSDCVCETGDRVWEERDQTLTSTKLAPDLHILLLVLTESLRLLSALTVFRR